MASLIMSVLFLITCFSLQPNTIFAKSVDHSTSSSYNLFAGDLLPLIVGQKTTKNVIYSPISIYTILALTYMGANGNTADELRRVLKLDQEEGKIDFALKYREFWNTTFNNTTPKYGYNYFLPPQLSIANRIYVSKDMTISEQFNKSACHYFDSGVENISFKHHLIAVQKINEWVAKKTFNKIKNPLQPDAVDEDTSMILVNAIHFKAKWLTSFKEKDTEKKDFHLNVNEIVKVDTMRNRGFFPFVALPALNARAVNLEFRNSDISMLIILPNEIDGLKQLEEKLKRKDLNDIVSKMNNTYLDLFLPKFGIEFNINLKKVLEKMGCSSMFEDDANLTDMFASGISHKVSEVKHKSFIKCSEYGLEAAASAFAKMRFLSSGYTDPITSFAIDHPFFFAIRNKVAVFFAGHVAEF